MARRLPVVLATIVLLGLAAQLIFSTSDSETWFDPPEDGLADEPVDVGYSLLAATGALRPVAVAVAAEIDALCWAEEGSGRLRCADRSGRTPRLIAEIDRPQGIAIDAAAQRAYWTADGNYPRRIGSSPLTTDEQSGPTAILWAGVDVNRPLAIVFHAASRRLSWSEAVSGRLRQATLPDSAVTDLRTSGYDIEDRADRAAMRILGVAMRRDGGLLWSDMARQTIETMAADGSHAIVVQGATNGILFPTGVASDDGRGFLYWADAARSEVLRARLDGSNPEVIVGPAHGLIEPRGLAFDPTQQTLYWTDAARDVIGRIAADGSLAELTLAAAPEGFLPIAERSEPASCDGETTQLARLRAQTAVQLCLEKVEAHQAVKVEPADVRAAADLCIHQLQRLKHEATGWAKCLAASDREELWKASLAQDRRSAWKLEEVRPFVAASQDVGATAALAILDEFAVAIRHTTTATPKARGGAPASGQRIPYGARRAGDRIASVPDDGMLRSGAPPSFIDNRDGTITDAATGLMWEKKCDGCDGLHDVRRQARWSSAHDETVWDWLAAVNAENGSGFAGHDDWRLPNLKELHSLLDYDRFNPSVGTAFDGASCGLGCTDLSDPACSCTETSEYWTSTTQAASPDLAFYVGFHLGLVGDLAKSDDLPMRAVRGGRTLGLECRDPFDEDGATPLLLAVLDADVERTRRLLTQGADANCRTQLAVRVITARGADVPEGVHSVIATPMLVATFVGNAEILRLLVQHGGNVDGAGESGHRPLHLAATEGHKEAVAALLSSGASVDAAGENASTALLLAAEHGHEDVVQLLLAAGAAPDRINQFGSTPLLAAIEHGHLSIVEELLTAGAKIDPEVVAKTLPPLFLAIAVDDRAIVELLLQRGAEARQARRVSSDALAEHDFEIETGLSVELTPLMLAAQKGAVGIGELLLAHGAEPAFANAEGISALWVAIFVGNEEFAAWILDHGGSADQATLRGDSPLIVAIEQAHTDLVRVLLEGGANPNLSDARGTTPMRAALEQGDDEILALLGRHGATPESPEDHVLKVARIDTTGFDPRVPTIPTTRRQPLGLAVDPEGGWIYWSEYASHALRRSRSDGSGAETLLAGRTHGPIGVALDASGRWLYWTSDAAYPRRIQALQIGTDAEQSIAEGASVNRPRAIATSATQILWTEAVNGRLRSIRERGADVVDLFTDGISSFGDRADFQTFYSLGLTADPSTERLYWTDVAASSIETAGREGNQRRRLFAARDGVTFPAGIAVDAPRGYLYWADVAQAAILRAPLQGGSPAVVVDAQDGLIEPRAIAVDSQAGRLYWTDASRDVIGRSTLDGDVVEFLALGTTIEAGFVARAAAPTDCAGATRHAAREFALRALKHVALCLETIDVFKAVKRDASDVRNALPVCIGQLAELHPSAATSLESRIQAVGAGECGATGLRPSDVLAGCAVSGETCTNMSCAVAACRRQVWHTTASRFLRAYEWLDELRPFLAGQANSTTTPNTDAARHAHDVLTSIRTEIQPQANLVATSAKLPRTGMTTSYRAVRLGSEHGVEVTDDGAQRTGAAARFRDNGDGTLTDLQTGLMWEKKADAAGGLHAVDESYAWSSDDSARTIWDWLDALNQDGGSGFAGYSDWRIPNIKELQSIVDYEVFNPAVARTFHNDGCGLGCSDITEPTCNCTAMSGYWSSTTYSNGPGRAFALLFNLGLIGDRGKDEPAHVRAVRNAAAPSTAP